VSRDPALTVEVLVEALPYLRQFRGSTMVVKFGGNAMVEPDLMQTFADDIVLLQSLGIRPVVVHGGGPQIGDVMDRFGKEPEFVDGLRVTDAETLEIAAMVLVGKVNRQIVSAVNTHGPLAVGLSGEDGGLIEARERNPALGYVGDVEQVNTQIIERLLAEDLIPVVSTIGADLSEGQAYNINADTAAGAIAASLQAEKILYLSDVPGLLRDLGNPTSLISRVSPDELRELVDDGALSGGMIPKVMACLDAIDGGVRSAHLLDGRIAHVLLLELFTATGIGTMVSHDDVLRKGVDDG
jgi:acetylglutamate kinase